MSERVKIELVGAPEDGGHVRLSELIAQLEAVKGALTQSERLVHGSEASTVYYRVVELHHSSPATIVLEAAALPPPPKASRTRQPDYSGKTVQKFFDVLEQIDKRTTPEEVDLRALEAFRNLTGVLDKHVSTISIENAKTVVRIDSDFKGAVDQFIGPDELAEGSILGTLEKVNLHNTTTFHIYPTIGPSQVACDFPAALRPEVVKALDKYVRVSGTLRYKKREPYPHAINVTDIGIQPPENKLPTLSDLRGLAPDATGDKTTEDFIYSVRHAAIW